MSPDRLELPRLDDLHVHLRQGAMLRAVTPLSRRGGAGRVLVMPNTVPPVRTVAEARAYREELRAVEPGLDYRMALYLTPELTVDEVARAAADDAVAAVKSYPRGVTTHSDEGVDDWERFDPLFAAMEREGLVLCLHGELPSDPARDVCCLNAEQAFLPVAARIHERFPRLRMVLEHVTTGDAVRFVERAGETVAATITAHHLELCADDWAGRNHHFCKPVAKYPRDRDALRRIVRRGHPRFFLGSDSAPHPRGDKEAAVGCAGVFTAAHLAATLADTFARLDMLPRLPDFATRFGRAFYGWPETGETIVLERGPTAVPERIGEVVPFRAGATLSWRLGPA